MENKQKMKSVAPPHEDKGAEDTPWELAIIRNIWRRAYMVPEEEHVKVLTEYGLKIASNERNRAIQECIDVVILTSPFPSQIVYELSKLKT